MRAIHLKTTNKADGADPQAVHASDWNADHTLDLSLDFTADQASTYTLQLADNGKMIRATGAGAVNYTLPNNLPKGFNVAVLQRGAGQVTFVPGAGSTLLSAQGHTKTASQYAVVSLIVNANVGGVSAEYILAGDAI